MLQTGFRLIVGVRAIVVIHAGIPRRARIHGFVTGLAAAALSIEDGLRPWFAVPEARLVIISKHAEDRHSETGRRQLLNSGGGYPLGVLLGEPAKMRGMNELGYTGIDGSHHGLRAHRMDLDPDAGFLRLIDDGPESLQFFRGRPRLRSESYFAGKLDSHPRYLPHFGTGLLGTESQTHRTGRDDSRSLDQAFLNVVLDRKSTRLNSSHLVISYAVFCLKKKKKYTHQFVA